jgi:hypothetical protein
MKNTEIKFYNSNGDEINAKLKPFISADMIVEFTKIFEEIRCVYYYATAKI